MLALSEGPASAEVCPAGHWIGGGSPDLVSATFAARLKPIVASDAELVSDGRHAYSAFAHANDILHIAIIARHGELAYEGFVIQNVNPYPRRLKGWMAPFHGVASKYLPSYIGRRRMIERDGETLTPRHRTAEALG